MAPKVQLNVGSANRFGLNLVRFPTWKIIWPIILMIATSCVVQGGFWTFYFPNILKPTGYSELTQKIKYQRQRINSVKDSFADSRYFWGTMQQFDEIDKESIYPENSACADIFPLFRNLAIEYAHLDYEYYMKPLTAYLQRLESTRTEWFPAGKASKTILPRKWEQDLFKEEIELRIKWHLEFTEDEEFKEKRLRLLNIWKSAKRGLDSSLECIYLRYAYRQIAEDINQTNLENSLRMMHVALKMIISAYSRIESFAKSDQEAVEKILLDKESTGK